MLLIAALASGCGSSTETASTPKGSAFSPSLRDFLASQETAFRPSLYDPPLETLKTDNRAFDDVRPALGFVTPALADTIPGFRVQVLLTQDIDEASGVRAAVARSLPDEWVYLIYDLPYYKVRVGNYMEREAANVSVKKIVGLGYPDAWVVPEKILRNPPPPPVAPAAADSAGGKRP